MANITRKEYDKINEALIRKNPSLARINEKVIYDKEFLLEVQAKGYNPLDSEDVQNYLEQRSPKNLDRNLKLCGADIYNSLGQSEYEDVDVAKLRKQEDINISVKQSGDVYLSDIPLKNVKEYLTEEKGAKDIEQIIHRSKKLEIEPTQHKESEDTFRKNIARVFGSEETYINKSEYISNSKEMIKTDSKSEKLLELIKELRALGFTPEEIKLEIKRFH